MTIQNAAVIGLGTMGAGIAEVMVRSGLRVHCVEINDDLVAAGRRRIDAALTKSVDRGQLSADDRSDIESRLVFTTDRSALSDADLVIEAVPERLPIKTDLFASLESVCPPHTIFATNTSSLPVTAIAAATARPARVIGMHFFNPAPVMKLVEVISTVLTDPAVTADVVELATRCGKTPVAVGDRAGFVANTLLLGYLGHAASLIDSGVVSVADIDAAMTASCGLPMGPARLMDLIGLDVCVEVIRVLNAEFGLPRYVLAPQLLRLMLAGRLGRKSGEGYYRYEGRDATPSVSSGPSVSLEVGSTPTLAVIDRGETEQRVRDAFGGFEATDPDDADVILVGLGDNPQPLRVTARRHPGKPVIGVHLPTAPRPTPMIELVVTDLNPASPESLAAVRALAEAAGRTVVVCRARPGYVVQALLFAQLDDAARMVGDGYATQADVDAAMTLGCGYPSGPFGLLAEVGATAVVNGLAAAGLTPAPLLLDLDAGLS